jgi:flagellar M-ring protein FliF
MTPGARIVAGLLLAVVLASVGLLFQQSAAGPDEFLFGGEYLSQSELTKVEAAIAVRKLSGYQRDGNRIRVPAAQKEEYLAAVAEADALPRSFHDLMQRSLDAGSVFETREDARHRRQITRAQTISEIVRKMSWVEDAVVLVDEQTPSGLNRKRQVTGSVTVQPVPGESLTPERVKALENLMIHSVAGLTADAVAVTSMGDDLSYGADGMSPHLFENDYLRARMMFNEYKRREILRLLSKYIPGVGVEVNAELENISEQIERNVKPEEKTAQLREIASTDTTERTTSDPSGRPGLDAQGPYRDGATVAAQQNTDKAKSTTRDNQYFAGYADQQVRKAGYMPTAVHATVAVPRSYVADIWRQRNRQTGQADRPPAEAELDPIESDVRTQVENLINEILPGTLVGENKYKYVTVEFVDSIDRPEITPPSLAENALAWTGRNWGSLTMACLAVFSLLMLRSMVKTTPDRNAGPALALESSRDQRSDAEEADDEAAQSPRLRLKKGESLQDDLVAMVREDPDAAATILKNWIANAA